MRVRNQRLQPTAAAIQPYSSTPVWQHWDAFRQKSTLWHCSRVSGSGWWLVKVELLPLLASAKQADWKEAKTRLRTRAAGGAGFMLEREASAGPVPWRCAECRGHVPVCVLSGRSLKTRPSEVNFYSVFGKRKRVEQRKFSCHTFLLPL